MIRLLPVKVKTDEKAIDELLTRSISNILPSKEQLKKELMSGKRLRIYIGADATGPDLHIGHATNFILIEKLRKLGHEVIVLFGDFTAKIGDPTGKDEMRKMLSDTEVKKNISTWKKQLGKVLKLHGYDNPAKIKKNSNWLSSLTFTKVIELFSNFTLQQMIERDMFQARLKDSRPIYMHEFFYPLMQGFDSVHMNVDIEVGGNDQTFNMMIGRTLQKIYNQKEKYVIATTLLENPKTGQKLMSKSLGNYISLNDSPKDMYGKAMALPDETIISVFTDCTFLSLAEIEVFKKKLEEGENPRNIKARLAFELVKTYHSEKDAQSAERNFNKTFSQGEIPQDIEEILIKSETLLSDVLIREGIVSSKTEWRRLITEGAVKDMISGEKIIDDKLPAREATLKVGKRRFVKLTK